MVISFYWINYWNCKNLSNAPMLSTHNPGRETTVTVGTITSKPKNISLCTPIWAPQLQCNAICIHRNGGFNPQKNDTAQNIRRTLQKLMFTRHIL